MNGVNKWGVVYESIGKSLDEAKSYPLKGWENLKGYIFPDLFKNGDMIK